MNNEKPFRQFFNKIIEIPEKDILNAEKQIADVINVLSKIKDGKHPDDQSGMSFQVERLKLALESIFGT